MFPALAVLLSMTSNANGKRKTIPREVLHSRRVIISELAMLQSPSIMKARDRCGDTCYEGNDLEMIIGLIGIGDKATSAGLVDLLALNLDGAGSEERSCQIAKRGRSLISNLQRFDSRQAVNSCRHDFAEQRKHELSDVSDVSVSRVCRPIAETERDRRLWIRALRSSKDLFAESGPC